MDNNSNTVSTNNTTPVPSHRSNSKLLIVLAVALTCVVMLGAVIFLLNIFTPGKKSIINWPMSSENTVNFKAKLNKTMLLDDNLKNIYKDNKSSTNNIQMNMTIDADNSGLNMNTDVNFKMDTKVNIEDMVAISKGNIGGKFATLGGLLSMDFKDGVNFDMVQSLDMMDTKKFANSIYAKYSLGDNLKDILKSQFSLGNLNFPDKYIKLDVSNDKSSSLTSMNVDETSKQYKEISKLFQSILIDYEQYATVKDTGVVYEIYIDSAKLSDYLLSKNDDIANKLEIIEKISNPTKMISLEEKAKTKDSLKDLSKSVKYIKFNSFSLAFSDINTVSFIDLSVELLPEGLKSINEQQLMSQQNTKFNKLKFDIKMDEVLSKQKIDVKFPSEYYTSEEWSKLMNVK